MPNAGYLGTKGYMAPEVQAHGATRLYDGTKADIFSLGALMFVMSTGVPPFVEACLDNDSLY